MSEIAFEAALDQLWQQGDHWFDERLAGLRAQGTPISIPVAERIAAAIEDDLNQLVAGAVQHYGTDWSPGLFADAHHFFCELALQQQGVANQEQVHRYKDNAQVALSVAEGRLRPANAELAMEVNRAHHAKKGGRDDAPCEDCVCGRS